MTVTMMQLVTIVTTVTSVLAAQKKPETVAKLIAHSVNASSHDCTGCDFVGDLRCKFEYRDEFFHRINNCLWPMYDVVKASKDTKGLRCFIVEKSLVPVLEPLVKGTDYRMIGSKSDCIDSMTGVVKAVQYPEGALAGHGMEASKEQKSQIITNRHYLAEDAAQVASPVKQPYLILILRKGKDTNRVFDKDSENRLKQAMEKVGAKHGLSVVKYYGTESQEETIGLFAHASGVVGFHGGGFANVLFASKPQCVVEMTTFLETDYSDKTLARLINLNVGWYCPWNDEEPVWKAHEPATCKYTTGGVMDCPWSIHGVPLGQIIKANGNEKELSKHSAGGKADPEFLIHQKSIPLTDDDVSEVTSMLDKCL